MKCYVLKESVEGIDYIVNITTDKETAEIEHDLCHYFLEEYELSGRNEELISRIKNTVYVSDCEVKIINGEPTARVRSCNRKERDAISNANGRFRNSISGKLDAPTNIYELYQSIFCIDIITNNEEEALAKAIEAYNTAVKSLNFPLDK